MPATPSQTEEELLQQRSSRPRLFQLDALRGLAAFCVVWHHLREAYPPFHSNNPLLAILTAGHQAVVLFFLLSGYVLGLPFWAGKQMPYGRYLLRRFFRIYVPYFAALVFAWLCAEHFLHWRLPLSDWYYTTWQTPLTAGLFLRQVFISLTTEINTAFWSLRLEAEFSILLPAFCWIVARFRAAGTLVLCAISYVVAVHLSNWRLAFRLRFYPIFLLGLLLSLYSKPLTAWFRARSVKVRYALFIAAFLIYIKYHSPYADAVNGFTSSIMILASLTTPGLERALRHAVPEYLGRISYSLYLIHGTALFATLDLLYGKVASPVLWAVYGAAAFLIAHLFCRFIEEPAAILGKRLTTVKAPS